MKDNFTKTIISSSAISGATLGTVGAIYTIANGSALFVPPISVMLGLFLGAIGSAIYIIKSKNEKETPRKQSGNIKENTSRRNNSEERFSTTT